MSPNTKPSMRLDMPALQSTRVIGPQLNLKCAMSHPTILHWLPDRRRGADPNQGALEDMGNIGFISIRNNSASGRLTRTHCTDRGLLVGEDVYKRSLCIGGRLASTPVSNRQQNGLPQKAINNAYLNSNRTSLMT